MSKKSTRPKVSTKKRHANQTYIDIFGQSLNALFSPNSKSKLINYKELDIVNWNELKLINGHQLNLLNFGMLATFIEYLGAFVFVFTLVFALPFRIYAETSITINSENETYSYYEQELTANTLYVQQTMVNSEPNLPTNNDLSLEDQNLLEDQTLFADFILYEMVEDDLAFENNSASVGNVLGAKTITIDSDSIFTEQQLNTTQQLEADTSAPEITSNTKNTQITNGGSNVVTGTDASLANATAKLTDKDKEVKPVEVKVAQKEVSKAIPSKTIAASEMSDQFVRSGSCSFKNEANYYSSGAVINIDEMKGQICFNVDGQKSPNYEVGFTNLKGQTIVLSTDEGCVDANRIAGLQGALEVSFAESEQSQCSLVLASL